MRCDSVQVDLTKINENTKRNLEVEIAGFQTSAAEQANGIKKLSTEKERYAAEAAEAADRYAQALEAVKEREISVLQLQKKIAEGEARLKQQQNLYEAVRSDRNLYAKNLIESQDEIAEMKRKFKVMTRQIEQLKEEIQVRRPSQATSQESACMHGAHTQTRAVECIGRAHSRGLWSAWGAHIAEGCGVHGAHT